MVIHLCACRKYFLQDDRARNLGNWLRVKANPKLPSWEDSVKQSEIFRENAEHCSQLAESAINEPTYRRYKRMEAAWRALAHEQDWLDGEIAPTRKLSGATLHMNAHR